jgi:hypothetical protein
MEVVPPLPVMPVAVPPLPVVVLPPVVVVADPPCEPLVLLIVESFALEPQPSSNAPTVETQKRG